MRTWVLRITLSLVAVIRAGTAFALDNVAMRGSDTVAAVAENVLAQCSGAAGITYLGGGSTTGENAMTSASPTQTVAPMSRTLNPVAGVCAKGTTAEGMVIGLDGIVAVAGATNANVCGAAVAYTTSRSFQVTDASGAPVKDCTGCDAGTNTYRIADWKDVLALLYAGKTHVAGAAADCASHVRRSLVDNWANLFEGGCSGGSCTQLKRAFRRADLSGTTDTFLSLLGLPSMPLAKSGSGATSKPIAFCNAHGAGNLYGGDSDYLDNDPIRRPCDASEEVCGRTGDLGLVTVVEVPMNLTAAQNYPTQTCGLGKFRLLKPAATGVTVCPNGKGPLFGKCFQPTIENADGTFTAECVARKSPVQGFGGAGMDGRAYNLYAKDANGLYRKDASNRFITGAFYRLHANKTIAAGAALCKDPSPTSQVGCLAQANPCAIGFSGRDAQVQGSVGLSVNGITPSDEKIKNLVTTPDDKSDDYPLARKLYFNTVAGFENVTGGELQLAQCMADSTKMAAIVQAHGFIPMPGGVSCEDFDETKCSGGPVQNTDACANNVAPIPNK